MGPEILEIQPRELKFTFELKKQSSCSVQLVNKSNEYAAFKVKTTSPKRYCVRPNTGVIPPRATCDFTVTMQAQRVAPPDMQLKDKFLVQSMIVPFGTTNEEVLPSFFSKDNGRYIEESKLRVFLVSPPHSPVLQPINGVLKQESTYEAPMLKEEPILKEAPTLNETPTLKETHISKDQALSGVEELYASRVKDADNLNLKLGDRQLELNKVKDAEDLNLKLGDRQLELNEAEKTEKTITMLREEKRLAIQQRDKLQQEIVLLRRRCTAQVQVGFPLLFVVFIALVGLALGYMLRPSC